MIRVTIEMLPFGDDRRAYVMARGIIHNKGTGTRARGNYGAAISKVSHYRPLKAGGWLRKGEIKDFPRTRLGVWDLLYRSLRELVGDRNP